MPGMITGNCPIAVFKARAGGFEVDGYISELDAVKGLIDNGTLGGRTGWGSAEHKAALDQVEAHIIKVRADIAEADEREAAAAGRVA